MHTQKMKMGGGTKKKGFGVQNVFIMSDTTSKIKQQKYQCVGSRKWLNWKDSKYTAKVLNYLMDVFKQN